MAKGFLGWFSMLVVVIDLLDSQAIVGLHTSYPYLGIVAVLQANI